ncbi:MAG: hypothetical protein KGK17_04390 [Betaproteobacteria bacterium]|nr:hypothetical protein [Betaproteobacteria bacterium]
MSPFSHHLKSIVIALLLSLSLAPLVRAADAPKEINGVQVLEAFDRQQADRVDSAASIGDKKKHLIMFMLGIPLLILLLSTGAVGVAMGLFGKPLFLVHMILAGLTMTLALVHVIVGLVWFYPF